MTESSIGSAAEPSGPPPLPIERRCPLDPPEELGRLRAERPVSRMRFPDGHEGWLATSHSAVRAVLAGSGFSARRELLRTPVPVPVPEPAVPAEPGNFIRMDPPEHTRYRRLLTGQFTVRRVRELEPRIEHAVEVCLDAMERSGREADLVQAFALPIPSFVICELLGVPFGDREQFQQDVALLLNMNSEVEQIMAAHGRVNAFVADLVARKRRHPEDDLLSGLAADGELTDEELMSIAFLLFAAGYETTANMLALGTYTLLRHPDQLARLREDPSLFGPAVEELLRYLTIIHIGPVRTALEDTVVEGCPIAAGESVTVSLGAANRDPLRFPDPDRFDVGRVATGHVAFGHGVHQCLGQQLGRMELRIALAGLFGRFPDLRLAVPAEEVPMGADMTIYGIHRLPVRW